MQLEEICTECLYNNNYKLAITNTYSLLHKASVCPGIEAN